MVLLGTACMQCVPAGQPFPSVMQVSCACVPVHILFTCDASLVHCTCAGEMVCAMLTLQLTYDRPVADKPAGYNGSA